MNGVNNMKTLATLHTQSRKKNLKEWVQKTVGIIHNKKMVL